MNDKIANYIIFHSKRQPVEASATVIYKNGNIAEDWKVLIYVDNVYDGNEDPFVFNDPWLYSYCHASQLRRNQRTNCHLQSGSKLIFIDGSEADRGNFVVDTVFIVKDTLLWGKGNGRHQNQCLPTKYANIMNNESSELWNRHFKFPFENVHKNVTHTYEAELWGAGKEIYSFLPLNSNGRALSLPIAALPLFIQDIVGVKRKGKYPILIESDIINKVIAMIEAELDIKVVKNIKLLDFEQLKCKYCGGC